MSPAIDLSAFVETAPSGEHRLDLAVEGITCAACIGDIERGLAPLPGLASARVNYTHHRLTLIWGEDGFDPSAAVARLARLGYKAHPFRPSRQEEIEAAESRDLLRRLAVAGFAAMNIMLLSVSVWSGNVTDIGDETRDLFHWLSALIALPSAAYAGRPFFANALRALRNRSMTMDVPISLGVTLALGLSLYETIHSAHHAYFDSAVMLLFFLLLGRVLDQSMRRRTRAVADNLMAMRGETAVLLGPEGAREVPVRAVRPGDDVLVRPGDRVAVDGVVIEGTSEIDASLVTGETAREPVRAGAQVYAGTLNVSGALTVRATAPADSSLIAEVNRLVADAAEARSRYLRLADRAARIYSPVVHVTALLTCIGWLVAGATLHDALVIAIAVLIITCPCALALAVPATQVVAAGSLFKAGVLLQSPEAVERIAACDMVVFDKTGTLTLPEPRIADRERHDPELLGVAARLALSSRHPLAVALAAEARGAVPYAGVEERAGEGVVATIDGVEARLGSPVFCSLEDEAAEILAADPEATAIAFRMGDRGEVFALRQALRPDAREVVETLRKAGFRMMILSGDREGPVAAAAAASGIAEWRARCKPADKIAVLEALKAEGRKVLMAGDGLNDAPALAAAWASISPVTAAHVAQASADALFMGERLAPVAAAASIARRALSIMRQNLGIAVVYNMIAVPLAMAGHVTPLIAAAAMSGSSVIVTLNALRARPDRSASPARSTAETARASAPAVQARLGA